MENKLTPAENGKKNKDAEEHIKFGESTPPENYKNGENHENRVIKHLPLVYAAAKRFAGRGAEYDELCQAGALGLITAFGRYDETRNIPFPAYAFKFIEGEIRKLLRSGCAVHISRSARAAAAEALKFIDEYEKRESKSPCVSEISRALGIEKTELCAVMNAVTECVPLDSEQGRSVLFSLKSGDDTEKAAVSRLTLAKALEALPEPEAEIIVLRYFKDMTQPEIAGKLNCSQSRVSKLEKSALIKIKSSMRGN